MKKFHLIGIICLGVCVFTGCKKDKEKHGESNPISTITATSTSILNAAAAADVAIVKVMKDSYEAVTGEYSSGFMLTLPITVPAEELGRFGSPSGLKVSDPDVGLISIESVKGYSDPETLLGSFYCYKEESDGAFTLAVFWYVDGDVTVTGKRTESDETQELNINLKKGWNMVYFTEVSKNYDKLTTTPKSDMKWVFGVDLEGSTKSFAKFNDKIHRTLSLFK